MNKFIVGLLCIVCSCAGPTDDRQDDFDLEEQEEVIETIYNVAGFYQGVLSLEYGDCGSNSNGFPVSNEIGWIVEQDANLISVTTGNGESYGFAVENSFTADARKPLDDGFRAERYYEAYQITNTSARVTYHSFVYDERNPGFRCGAVYSGNAVRQK